MQTWELKFPNKETEARAVDALCGLLGYQVQVPGHKGTPKAVQGVALGLVENPETREDFAKRVVIDWLKGQVTSWETQKALATITQKISKQVDEELDIS